MHKKIRGNTAYLYRSNWVPKGTAGNTHGYAVQRYVGSIPVQSQSIPEALLEVLTADELEYLMNAICLPAADADEQLQRKTELRERDPVWRLEEAARLVGEAVVRSANWPVTQTQIALVTTSLSQVRSVDAALTKPV